MIFNCSSMTFPHQLQIAGSSRKICRLQGAYLATICVPQNLEERQILPQIIANETMCGLTLLTNSKLEASMSLDFGTQLERLMRILVWFVCRVLFLSVGLDASLMAPWLWCCSQFWGLWYDMVIISMSQLWVLNNKSLALHELTRKVYIFNCTTWLKRHKNKMLLAHYNFTRKRPYKSGTLFMGLIHIL